MFCMTVHHCPCIPLETVWLAIQSVGLKYPIVDTWMSLLFLYTVSQSAGRVWRVAESHSGSHWSNTSNPYPPFTHCCFHLCCPLNLSVFLHPSPQSLLFLILPPFTLRLSFLYHDTMHVWFSTVATQLDIAVDDEAISDVWEATRSNSTHHWWAG